MLLGTVTDATGAPIWAANITIIDPHGQQLTRTSTDHTGTYALENLPDDTLTILLSPPGKMPIATCVTLTTDLPTRQDFVLPDPPARPSPSTAAAPPSEPASCQRKTLMSNSVYGLSIDAADAGKLAASGPRPSGGKSPQARQPNPPH